MIELATSIALRQMKASHEKSGGKKPPDKKDHFAAKIAGMKWITWHGKHFLVPDKG
jgi:hypothetical protein